MLRAVDGIDWEAKLDSELPIPVVQEPSKFLFGDGDGCRDGCRIVVGVVRVKSTTPGTFIDPDGLVTFEALPGVTLMDPCLHTGMQPAATDSDAPLMSCGGDSARLLCGLSRLRALAIAVTGCGDRANGATDCVEGDELILVHDREIGMPEVGVRLETAGVGVQ